MPEFPHELIRQLQISSRAAAGLSAYDPQDPTLPALPPLAATIASLNPSQPDLRCSNCKGKLLRGIQSNICVYCGRRPQNDVAPEPICFTSTTGYQWLLRSLRLDGSEMVKPVTGKTEKNQGQSFPKAENEIQLSDFLNFKVACPAQTDEEEETSVSEQHAGKSRRRPVRFTGVAPDNFFFKSKRDACDISSQQPVVDDHVWTKGTKDPNFFQNAQSSDPAGISLKDKNNEGFSAWEADFQFADQEDQRDVSSPSDHLVDSSADSANKVQESESFGQFTGSEVDLSAHMDSVFGSGKDLNDGQQTDNPAASPTFNDWNSDEIWNNPISNDNKPDKPNQNDLSASFDSFPDFEWQTHNANSAETTTTNEENKTINTDSFDEWNDFTGSSSLQDPFGNMSVASIDLFSASDEKSLEIDLFSSNTKFESDFSQPDLHSASTSNSSFPAEVNATVSEDPASKRSNDGSGTSHEFGQAANTEDGSGKSTEAKNEYANLISQMHDLSFMLESDLSIPSSSDSRNSSTRD